MQVAEAKPSVPKSRNRPEAAVPFSLSFWPHITWGQPADCEPGEPLDTSSANDARQRIKAAGFADPQNLYKSCDNFWYGAATSNGKPVFVRMDPEGRVRLD